jgi:hypothetical protein
VYRLYAADGALLYVGSSFDPDARYNHHRRQPWGFEIARRTIDWCADRGTAYKVEAAAILAENPRRNQYGKVDPPNSDAVLRRNELSRMRARTLSQAAGICLDAERAVQVSGGSRIEAIVAGIEAKIEFLAQTGLHAKRVAELADDAARWRRRLTE